MKKIWAIVIILVVLAVIGLVFYETRDIETSPESKNSIDDTVKTEKQLNIEIKSFAFSPNELTIRSGEKIVWTNQDSAPHTITSDLGNELTSKRLNKGESFSYTFNNAGIYEYHCELHKTMKAKVIVR